MRRKMKGLMDLPEDKDEGLSAPVKHSVGIFRKIYELMASVKLAIGLLVAILVCCVVGVTIYRGDRSWTLIFGTLWFNGLLVLLVMNVVFCFFGRMWGRKLTMISLGMILFHLSFVAMCGGIIFNSLYYFRGVIRLTEGESLPSGKLESYDAAQWGRFFRLSKLKGETTLIKLHLGFKIAETDKKVAYEVAVGRGNREKQGIIYITHSLDHDGIGYFRDKEGYSVLIVLYDRLGKELYGAYVPLQSLKQKDDRYLYTTGTATIPGRFPFPQNPEKPLLDIQVTYQPTPLKERAGEVSFQVWPHSEERAKKSEKEAATGKASVGDKLKVGDHYLSVKEVRYWAAMNVLYEPGQPIVLASMWMGLGGMIITFLGRMRKQK
jgi:hypothetical protein